MRIGNRMTLAALLLGLTFGGVTTLAAHAASPGCPSASQKAEQEGGSGGTWQQNPGAGAQQAEQEGGSGGTWQQNPGAGAQQAEQEGGSGGTWQQNPGAGAQQAAADPCR